MPAYHPRTTWTLLRRISQATWLILFLWLFIQTDYHGADDIPYAVNILFRIDPLIGAAAILASRALIALLLPALFFLTSALLAGRWFCGWMCPMGVILDATHLITRGKQTLPGNPRRTIRFFLLISVLAAALFGFPFVGFVDPFAILVRGLAVGIYPAFDHAVTSWFTFTYQYGNNAVHMVTEPVYSILKMTVLPFQRSVFQWAGLSVIILAAVILLEKWERRAFCRNICPLGALYGITGRIGLLKGRGGSDACGSCTICRTICRMGAIDTQRHISMTDCNLCMECVEKCPRQVISFSFFNRKEAIQPAGSGISRRTFIGAAVTGLALPPLMNVHPGNRNDRWLLRPPGACGETAFLARCVRCGECMKVCIGNALHPALFEAGLTGAFSPVLIPRVGYCEYNCTLCGQVCPTGAIQRLSGDEKKRTIIGTAEFDIQRCLPYRGVSCMVCEEHCPVPEKAIRFHDAQITDAAGKTIRIRQPYVVTDKCIGCGICEHKCPLPGPSAVRVTWLRESRNPLHADPGETTLSLDIY